MANRIVLLIDMDAFFAQIEERENPQFRGKPLVVGADPKQGKGRGVVSTASYEARKYGIKSAMPISEAWRRCPAAIFVQPDIELYQKVSEKIMEIVKKYSPLVEVVSMDEAYADISFLKNFKKAIKYAQDLKGDILEKEKLPCTIGIGPNKIVAKIACEQAKPNGLKAVAPSEVEDFLAPLDIRELPGIGPKTAEKFRSIKINKIGEIRKLSENDLKNIFGKVGEYFYKSSRGLDNEPVIAERGIKSVGKEHTFEKDTRDSEIIFKTFDNIIKAVYKELAENKYKFKTITVVCRFSGWETHTKSKTLEEASGDVKVLSSEAKRMLLKFVIGNPKPVRLIGLRIKI